MAVHFFRKPESLIRDLRRRGYHVEQVESREGDPGRAMQIRLAQGLAVNWDRDSRSVWAEGPWPEVERLESALRSWYEGGWLRRLWMHPGTAVVVVLTSILIALVCSYGIQWSRRSSGVASPTTETAATPATATPPQENVLPEDSSRATPAAEPAHEVETSPPSR